MAGARFHPKYSGSNAHRFMACPGQVRLTQHLADIDTVHSREGTFAHLVLETAIKSEIKDLSLCVGVIKLDDYWIDQETAEAVQHAVDYVEELRREYLDLEVSAEYSVCSVMQPNDVSLGGTIDILCISAAAKTIWIIDYKHGAGERVEACDNKQLMTYLRLIYPPLLPTPMRYVGVIIQPRHWAYERAREKIFSWAEIFDFSWDLSQAIAAAEKPDAPLVPGPHCRHCKAEATCPANEAFRLQAMNVGVGDAAFFPPNPGTLDTYRLAWIMTHEAGILSWLRACKELALRSANQGAHIPGYKRVQQAARRKYRPDYTPAQIVNSVKALSGDRLRAADIMPPHLRPLTEVEAKLQAAYREAAGTDAERRKAAGAAKEAFAFLTLREPGSAVTLVPETDPRPAYIGSASADFAGVTIEQP
jgi:hypothetical protein